jgi:hypothetical protein
MFYAESWALVHSLILFLAGLPQLGKFVELLNANVAADEAAPAKITDPMRCRRNSKSTSRATRSMQIATFHESWNSTTKLLQRRWQS